jgi:integrase
MRADRRSKQELNSSAYLSYINVFISSQVELLDVEGENVAHFSPINYKKSGIQFSPVEDGVIRKFPIIIRGDSTPWDLGNLYLINKFTEMAKIEPPSVDTLKAIAKQLVMYLRWIEHEQSRGEVIHDLYFPEEETNRVTWRYHRYLRRLLRQNPQPISLNVIKARMQAVVGFYKGIIDGQLVTECDIKNEPYKKSTISISVVNSIGLQYIKNVEVSNFTIKKPRRDTEIGRVMDGGLLRPLDENEQTLVFDYLQDYGNRAFQLMCWVALFTGARIQTVGTLRMKHIYQLINLKPEHGEVLLKVGRGTDADTKNQTNYRLHFPFELVKALCNYIGSEEHRQRRAKSFYNDSDENYVFLTSNGSSYVTSQREIIDRQEGHFSQRISAKDRVSFTIQNGNAVRNYLQRLVRNIRCKNPDFQHFRYHDLRATYGMNFVRDAEAAGIKDVRENLRNRMGHKSFNTTQAYLNFDKNNELIAKVTAYHHDRINRVLKGCENND